MIVTIAKVADIDQFMEVFATVGVAKRREHGCRGARVFIDPDDPQRVWAFFDWDEDHYDGFLADPEIPALAQRLRLQEPPVRVFATAEFDF